MKTYIKQNISSKTSLTKFTSLSSFIPKFDNLGKSEIRDNRKIVLTGGHAGSTAYAVIQELKKSENIKWEVSWIGSRKAIEGNSITTFEHKIFNKIGIPFYTLNAGKLQTKFSFWTIPALIKIPVGFVQSLFYLIKIRPRIVLSFGGYAALPVVTCSWLLQIPVIIHEQTAAAGRANELGSRFANIILLARASSKKYYNKKKCKVVGNPVSVEIQSIKPKYILPKIPTILITGGSRGSILINNAVGKILTDLLKKYKVIHQTGEMEFERYSKISEDLPVKIRDNYRVISFIEPWYWNKLLDQADLVIGRSGANTVAEIIYIKKPSILIPLRIAYKNEQMENALLSKDFGISEVIEERDLNSESLLKNIEIVFANWKKMVDGVMDKKSPDENSAKKILEIIENI